MSDKDGQPACFTIMPINEQGTPANLHFRAIYEQIRQVVTAQGFQIIRADEVTEEGSIAKDLIIRLATARLVIADLTDLNPNVFWELGVRHALRASGTLLLIDETRTERPPFDLSYLRLLKYRGTVEGLSEMREQLTRFVQTTLTAGDQAGGSPVHDWLGHLPPDLSLPASESEGALRSEISEYRDQVQRYSRKYGALDEKDLAESHTPAERMRRMQRLVNAGRLPAQMMQAVGAAAGERDLNGFIERVSDAIDNRVNFGAREIMRLSGWADLLALDEVVEAILAYGEDLNPTDKDIRRARLARLAEGRSREDRAAARDAIARLIGFDLRTGALVDQAGSRQPPDEIDLLAFLTSSLHSDGLTSDALAVCQAFVDAFPGRATLLRLLGRAQEWTGDLAQGTQTLEEALQYPDVDDNTAYWLGNSFHNCGRHADAIEMYLIACWIDLDDSKWFAHCTGDLAFALCEPYNLFDPFSPLTEGTGVRQLPEGVTADTIRIFATYALSAPSVSSEALDRVEDSLTRAELTSAMPDIQLAAQQTYRRDRRQGVAKLFEQVCTDRTLALPPHLRPRTDTAGEQDAQEEGQGASLGRSEYLGAVSPTSSADK